MVNYIDIPEDEHTKIKRAQSIVGTSKGRLDNDFYPTASETTMALLDREQFDGTILENSCGDGAICKVLHNYGYKNVIATDLIDRGYGLGGCDFLSDDYPYTADNVIMNPPFILAQEFIEKSLKITTGKVAVLCKLVFLEGQKRKLFFEKTPLETVYVFSKRVNFYRNGVKGKMGTSMMAFAWMVWNHAYNGDPKIKWV